MTFIRFTCLVLFILSAAAGADVVEELLFANFARLNLLDARITAAALQKTDTVIFACVVFKMGRPVSTGITLERWTYHEANPLVRSFNRDQCKILLYGAATTALVHYARKKLPRWARIPFLVGANAVEMYALSSWQGEIETW